MGNEKLHIEKNTTQETLVIPLYARKLCTELYPSLFQDPAAIELMNRLDYDFSSIEAKSNSIVQKYGALEIAMRQNDLAIEVKDYLKEHPSAAVVNMGCGLDQTGENCDNGQCKIYNLDMPDVIEIRNQLIPETERITNISCDINDFSWFDKIDDSDGSVFFAAGVFYYFQIEEMKKLVNAMAKRFHGGKMVFDTGGKTALKMMMKTVVKQAGITNIGAYFHVEDMDTDVRPWLKNAKVSSRGYMLGYHDLKVPGIPGLYRFMARYGDNKLHIQIMRFDFDK